MAERKTAIRLPRIACEVTPDGVAAARAQDSVIGELHHCKLPAGAVTPALTSQNVQNARALSDAIGQALSAVGGRGQEVIAVLPDSAVRMTLLDFDSLPERRSEAEAAVRFRLRKSLPFDIDKAAVSFDPQHTPQGLRVAASIVLQSVLQEYESAFRDAGSSPGVVMPSSVGALGAVEEPRPAMLLKVCRDSTAVAVASEGQLLLFRILEGALEGVGNTALTAAHLADDIYPSLVYFQDTYGLQVEHLLVSGVPDLKELAPALEEHTGMRVRELIGPGIATGAAAGSGAVADYNLRNHFAGAIGALL
jgi:type IV pilus assembly protein PilM